MGGERGGGGGGGFRGYDFDALDAQLRQPGGLRDQCQVRSGVCTSAFEMAPAKEVVSWSSKWGRGH